ncbi:MAG TPA: AraC family transcriptional regulator [Polyangiaceae bacterium]
MQKLTHGDLVLPLHHPSVLISVARSQGADLVELLEGTGASPEMLSNPEARISYEQNDRLVANALRLTNNPALGLDFGRSVHLSHLGVLGLLVMSCPDGRSAIEFGFKYYRTVAPGWDLRLEERGPLAHLRAREVLSRAPFREFATEALLFAMSALAGHLFGESAVYSAVREVRLNYSAPAYARRYREIVPSRFQFDCKETHIVMDSALLSLPISGADRVTAAWAARQCEAQLSSAPNTDSVTDQVRRLLRAEPGRYATLDAVADGLGTNPRSLRRGLQRAGTSFQELLDGIRRAQALEYISSSGLTCEQIAGKLGFRDARSFRRAFKRWTGATPNEYRNAAGGCRRVA